MDSARWNRIEDLLQAALDRSPDQRASFVRSACGSDDDLRREVELLLGREAAAEALSGSIAAVGPAEPVLQPGQQVGRYRIERRIGSGGMAEVYEARDENLQRSVALKTLPPEFTTDPDRVRRFEQEAFAASRLNHPNIITIYEILHADDVHLIATERVEGRTLRELLAGETGGPKALPAAQAIDIAIQIAEALRAAHTAWIIHRDIKPENVMVRSDGLVKVLDFGIAKLTDEPSDARGPAGADRSQESPHTMPGAVIGTARYMSPEQARGEPLDGRTDLFSLGLVLHEMVTGSLLPAELTRAVLRRTDVEHALAAAAKAIPRELQRVIARMLQPDREQRYSSAGEVVGELRALKRRIENRTARRMIGLGAIAVIIAISLTAAGAWLSIAEVWDERVLRDGHTAAVREVLFSPDGRLLVTCSEDGRMIVWDFARRQRVRTLDGAFVRIAFAPDGRTLASSARDGAITVWDATSWRKLRTLREHRTETASLAFSPDGTMLASGSFDAPAGRTIVWSTSNWSPLREFPIGGFGTYAFASDGRSLMSALSLAFMDLATGEASPQNETGANWIAMSPDGTQLTSVDSAGRVSFFRLPEAGGLRRLELIRSRRAHQDHGRSVAYSADGRFVATAADHIVVWDARTREKVAHFEHSAISWSVAFSPDGRSLVSSHADGAVLVWDLDERRRIANLNQHSGAVRAVAVSRDGRRVASGSDDRTVMIWDPDTGRKLAVLDAHGTRVTAVAFSRAGDVVASGDQDGVVVLWDPVSARLRSRRTLMDGPNLAMAISPDGRRIAVRDAVYSMDGQLVDDLEPRLRAGHVYGLAYSHDGRWLACVTAGGGYVIVLDADRLRVLERSRVAGTSQVAVAFSPDGKWLATGEDEGAVRLWSTSPLREVAILGRHAARVKSVAFSPDGRTVASAGDDKVIALWDVKRRRLRVRAGTHTSPIYSIAFSPDGRRLFSGEHDHSVRIYTRRRTLWGFRL